jgi:stress-induced morphogen
MEGVLKQRLEAAFVAAEGDSVDIFELEGCGDSFEVRVVSSTFEGTKRLQRHKMVNEAVGDLMDGIHALSIKVAKTPGEMSTSASA